MGGKQTFENVTSTKSIHATVQLNIMTIGIKRRSSKHFREEIIDSWGESRGDPYNEAGKEILEESLSSKSEALKNITYLLETTNCLVLKNYKL